jgi:hypothetical protein
MEVKAPAAACNPFAPPAIHSPDLTAVGSRSLAWFSAAAVVTWIACGLWPVASMLTGRLSGVPAAVCAAGLLVYGGALIAILRLPRREASRSAAILLATVESLMAITVTVTTAWYLGGTGVGIGLLAVVAAQLPYFFKSPQIWTWVTVQTVAMMWLVDRADNATLVETFVFTLVAIGFQVFAAASSILTISEGRARSNLARANSWPRTAAARNACASHATCTTHWGITSLPSACSWMSPHGCRRGSPRNTFSRRMRLRSCC